MSVEMFLLSMQIAGAIGDSIGTGRAISVGRAGRDVELAQIETRLEQERLASAVSSLDAMKQLRQVLASQRAISAARGADIGAGTAFAAQATSVSNYTADERVRRMNLLSKEATLRAHGSLSSLHQLASETKLGQQLSKRMFDQIPFNELYKTIEKKPTTTTTRTPIGAM